MEGWDLFYLGGDDEETDDEVKRMQDKCRKV